MVLRAQAVHSVHQDFQIIRIDVRRYPVSQVEHVAWPATVTCQYVGDALFYCFRGLAQSCRIKVAL